MLHISEQININISLFVSDPQWIFRFMDGCPNYGFDAAYMIINNNYNVNMGSFYRRILPYNFINIYKIVRCDAFWLAGSPMTHNNTIKLIYCNTPCTWLNQNIIKILYFSTQSMSFLTNLFDSCSSSRTSHMFESL